jgi:hypothetical protein
MRWKRVAGLLVIGTAAYVISINAYASWHFRWVAHNFDRIQVGQSRESVIGILGRPNYHSGSCLEDLKLSDHCVSELVYSQAFAPIIPEYYVVDLSQDGRVIGAENLNSP